MGVPRLLAELVVLLLLLLLLPLAEDDGRALGEDKICIALHRQCSLVQCRFDLIEFPVEQTLNPS